MKAWAYSGHFGTVLGLAVRVGPFHYHGHRKPFSVLSVCDLYCCSTGSAVMVGGLAALATELALSRIVE
jgi:hypothetical protein